MIQIPISSAVTSNSLSRTAPGALNDPRGIFVDTDLTLYVADYKNHRIQRFLVGEVNGTTVAGGTTNVSIHLHEPIAVILDADGSLFILDYGNSRILIQRSNGWRCLGTQNQLKEPTSFAFNSSGNILVAVKGRSRIDRFQLVSNSCSESLTRLLVSLGRVVISDWKRLLCHLPLRFTSVERELSFS